MENIYKFEVENSKLELVSMEKYKGKVLLIVNTATRCGYTKQLDDLEAIYKEYKDQGFEVLGFPCNQFLNQAPEKIDEFIEVCRLKYGVSFEQFNKVHVNGKETIPLYTYLKENALNVKGTKRILWNFEKFLVAKDGHVITRFAKDSNFKDIKNGIELALK